MAKVDRIANLAGSSLDTTDPTVVPQHVALTRTDGTVVESFGGGTQYTEGDTDASITGGAVMFETDTATHTIGAVSAASPLPTTPLPVTANGLSIFRSLDLDETEEQVKGTAGQVYGLWFSNTTASTLWLKFYNGTAASVTVGTTTPVITLGLPGNSSDTISGVFSSTMGIAFDTAITVAATTGVADNDTGATTANACIVNIFYK